MFWSDAVLVDLTAQTLCVSSSYGFIGNKKNAMESAVAEAACWRWVAMATKEAGKLAGTGWQRQYRRQISIKIGSESGNIRAIGSEIGRELAATATAAQTR